MLRLHDEQRNVVMVVIPRKRSFHNEGPMERGQDFFRSELTAIRFELAFPFRNRSEYSPPTRPPEGDGDPVAASKFLL